MASVRAHHAVLVVAATLALAACDVSVKDGELNFGVASGRATDEWKREYTVSPGGALEIQNVNGTITVEAAAEGQPVSVRAERTARAASDERARELLKQIEIREEVAPDAVRLETRAPSGWGRGHEVKYFVAMPPSIRVGAHTVNGAITLTGLSNDVDVSATNGGIEGDGLSGTLSASTTNGGMDVRVEAVAAGGIDLSTTNGGISLELPRKAHADIAARVTNGGISSDLDLSEREQSRRHLEGKLNDGGRRVELQTTNGGIQIRGK